MDQATADAIARVRATTGACHLCGEVVQQVPRGDEWRWANEAGGHGIDGDLRRNLSPEPRTIEDVYDALAWLREHNVKQYVMLKVRLDIGCGPTHQHQVHAGDEVRPEGTEPGPLPFHCAWPMRLAPAGWACRQCPHRQDTAVSLELAA
jgi:hypothetical protein